MTHSDLVGPRFVERPMDIGSDESLIKEATLRAVDFNIVVSQRDTGKYVGFAREFPRIFGLGVTVDECFRKTREAITGAIALAIRMGETIPEPLKDLRRHEQLNIRLTREEKAALQSAANATGARSLSDFARDVCLAAVARSERLLPITKADGSGPGHTNA